jgi:hypothetical protein
MNVGAPYVGYIYIIYMLYIIYNDAIRYLKFPSRFSSCTGTAGHEGVDNMMVSSLC